jgi:hypothetical protein
LKPYVNVAKLCTSFNKGGFFFSLGVLGSIVIGFFFMASGNRALKKEGNCSTVDKK